jgi:GNAT superfamily N-acetyltransferase
MTAAAPIPVRPITASEYREAIAVAARAFWYDPLIDFFSRDLLHEYKVLPRVFGGYLADVRGPNAELWVGEHNGRPRGVAGWLAPAGYPRPFAQEARRTLRTAAIFATVRNRAKAIRLFLQVERRHPHEPHWYLAVLATDPTVQGRGIGSALLAPILERCDREGLLAYTETQKPENVSWYARAGFTVSDEVRLPGTPPVWCLRREPRS